MRFNTQSTQTGEQSRKSWHQTVTLLLGLFASVILGWSQPVSWFYIIPGVLTLVSVILLLRDFGFFSWLRNKMSAISANRTAKREYKNLLRLIDKALAHRELASQLQNYVTWEKNASGQIDVPSFVSMSFENWYNDLAHVAELYKVRRIEELELIGQRFHDFLQIFNLHYLLPYANALRAGKVKYNSEQLMKSVRQAKESYDRFLHEYNDFCESLNTKIGRKVIVSFKGNLPPALDWSAAAPLPN